MQIGYTGWAILLPLLIGTLAVMRRTERSLDNNPSVQAHKMNPCLAIGIIVFAIVSLVWVGTIPGYLAACNLIAIQQHGRRAEGIVDTIYVAGCARGGPCHFNVQYHYSALSPGDGRQMQWTGNAYLSPRHSDDARFVYASTKRLVPIAYDLNAPQTSAVNFYDQVFAGERLGDRVARAQRYVWAIMLAIAIFLLWSLACIFAQRWLTIGLTARQTI